MGWRILSAYLVTRTILLSSLLIIASAPALFISCDPEKAGESPETGEREVSTDIKLIYSNQSSSSKASSWDLIKRTDVFVFKDNDEGELDSWVRFDSWNDGTFRVPSGAGRRKVVVLANSRLSDGDIHNVTTYEDILAMENDFGNDSPEYPMMSGEADFIAGSSVSARVVLRPLMSQIYIPSLTCRMSGKNEGKHLTDVKVYLTDINSRVSVMQKDGFNPKGIMNAGGLCESDLQGLDYSGIVYRYLGNGKKETGGAYGYGGASLYCYPNQSAEESAGSPFTKLVVEGTLNGETNYYTIPVNREGFASGSGEGGIGRNVRYSVEIKITGEGASSIDGPVREGESGDEVAQGSVTLHPGNIVTGRDGEQVHIWCEVYPEWAEVSIDEDDLDFDSGRGIYDYKIDEDGRGVTLTLLKNGTGMFGIDVGEPVSEGLLVIVVVNP